MISFQWITLSFLLVSGTLFAYLIPWAPAYERHHRAALARCAHRDRKPSFGAYGFENHPDICPDNQPEDQQRHGNPVP